MSLCRDCRVRPLTIAGIRSVVYLDGPLRKAIHRLKYTGIMALSEPLAQYMADYLTANPLAVDVVVPVPLHHRRQRERGFNQSVLLARGVAAASGLDVDERALARIRATVPQVGLDIYERRVNVMGAFEAHGNRVEGRRVLVVDDVCTTGATLEACGQALTAAGARSVWGFALARGH
jgi:ComF family protein